MKFVLRLLLGKIDEQGNVLYSLKDDGGKEILWNDFVGKKIHIKLTGKKYCIHCGKEIEKTYQKGSCEECFLSSPRMALCMIKPELCEFESGRCRDEAFAKEFCFGRPQYVYFSVTNDLKVGYFSYSNRFQRWVDQGAKKAIIVAELPSRKEAGRMESYLMNFLNDKTNWAKMLKSEGPDYDLAAIKEKRVKALPEEFKKYVVSENKVYILNYPVLKTPEKISRVNLGEKGELNEVLFGIKGQYLLFRDKVMAIRAYEGYEIELSVEEAPKVELASQGSLF